MLTPDREDSLAGRLDPRTKLAVQGAFAVAVVAHTTPRGLAVGTAVSLLFLAAARTSPATALRPYRGFAPLLVAAPVVRGLTLGPPWFSLAAARPAALAVYRVVLLLVVSAAYLRTTPVRESRAAIQWAVPGRLGPFLGLGVAAVLRFLPVLRADLRTIRDARAARLGDEAGVVERVRGLGTTALRRALRRADGLSLALRARCFSWNPTLPPLSFGRVDAVGWATVACLSAWAAL